MPRRAREFPVRRASARPTPPPRPPPPRARPRPRSTAPERRSPRPNSRARSRCPTPAPAGETPARRLPDRPCGRSRRSAVRLVLPSRSPPNAAIRRRRSPSIRATGSPRSSAAAIGFTLSGLAIRQPGGGSSSAKPSLQVPGRGDRGNPAGQRRDRAGQRVGAMVTADQRHRDRAVLGNGDYRRLLAFRGEQRRHRADQDAAGAEADNRPSRGEQLGDVRRRPIVALIPIGRVGARPVQSGTRQRRPQPCRPSSAPPRPSTMIAMSPGSLSVMTRQPPETRLYLRD